MTDPTTRLLVDCSVVVKWKITSEPYATQARELMLDGQNQSVEICAPDQLYAEVLNAFLGVYRKKRLNLDETREALREILAFPFTLYKTTRRIITRAFEIAAQNNQHAYDCIYVALAERKGIEFWTGDERLYNALHSAFPLIRRIADYKRKGP
jgi:predicted nucleic acid-binding protein